MPEFLTNIKITAVPSDLSHAARLSDVYDIVGSRIKGPVVAAPTGNLDGVYASLVLTATANGLLTVDGVSVAVGDRILLTEQTDGKQNGIYDVTSVGSASAKWTLKRSSDFDETSDLTTGLKIHVAQGVVNGDATFVLTTDAPVLDTTPLVWSVDNTSKLELVREFVGTVTGVAANSVTTYTFTHGFGTRLVTAEIIETTGYATVYADVVRTSDNDVAVTFGSAPQAGENYAVILRALV